MANHDSALKRAKQNSKRRLRNKANKTRIKNLEKTLEAAVTGKNPAEAIERLKVAQKIIARTASKGTIHRRTAARKIARLSRKVSRMLKAAEV